MPAGPRPRSRRLASRSVARAIRTATRPALEALDLHAGLITPPRVGQNPLGKLEFNRLIAGIGLDDQAILITARGLYSLKGTRLVRSGVFDRVQLVQGERTIRLTKQGYRNLERLRAPDAPELREIGVFVIPADTVFDPLASRTPMRGVRPAATGLLREFQPSPNAC